MSSPYDEHDGYKWPSKLYPNETTHKLLLDGLCGRFECRHIDCKGCAYNETPNREHIKEQLAVKWISTLRVLEEKDK